MISKILKKVAHYFLGNGDKEFYEEMIHYIRGYSQNPKEELNSLKEIKNYNIICSNLFNLIEIVTATYFIRNNQLEYIAPSIIITEIGRNLFHKVKREGKEDLRIMKNFRISLSVHQSLDEIMEEYNDKQKQKRFNHDEGD